MTTALAPSLPFRVYQPDILINTIHIKLPREQMDYLNLNKEMDRPQLFKAFRKKFNSNINKLQFNFNLETVREEAKEAKKAPRKIVTSYEMPDVEKARNVYWVKHQGVWNVKFRRNGKGKSYGTFEAHEHDKAVKAAEKHRKNLA